MYLEVPLRNSAGSDSKALLFVPSCRLDMEMPSRQVQLQDEGELQPLSL